MSESIVADVDQKLRETVAALPLCCRGKPGKEGFSQFGRPTHGGIAQCVSHRDLPLVRATVLGGLECCGVTIVPVEEGGVRGVIVVITHSLHECDCFRNRLWGIEID